MKKEKTYCPNQPNLAKLFKNRYQNLEVLMKKGMWSLVLLIIIPALAFAQQSTPKAHQYLNLGGLDWPSASTENLFTPLVNPSLLGTGNSSGFGWAQGVENMKLQKHYWLFANLKNLSYVFESGPDQLDETESHHTLAMGTPLSRNMYIGTSLRWQNSEIGQADWRSALTMRPHKSTSLALRLDNVDNHSPAYHAGLSLRPLAFVNPRLEQRLELSADMDYDKDDGSYGVNDLSVGIQTRLLDGLNIGGGYNFDKKTAMLNFSLSLNKTELGTLSQIQSGSKGNLAPYIHLSDNMFRPFLGLKKSQWYDMKLSGTVKTYVEPKFSLGNIRVMDSSTKSIETIIQDVKRAKDDESVKGILFKNPSFSTSYALLQEFSAALEDFKTSGKKISFYYNNISNGSYMFAASVADAIYLNPLGMLDLHGMSVNSPYFAELLDKVGVDVLNFRSHKYKNAGNMFSESEMTEAERESYDTLLESIFSQMVAGVEAGRGEKLAEPFTQLVDEGPYFLATDALDAGLIDKIIYEDELERTLKADFGFKKTRKKVHNYVDYTWHKPRETMIAVIYAQGDIVMGKGEPGKKIAHENTVKLIREARQNPLYKGIILRVDSGGGSAQASDVILRELELAQWENFKPVVVSMAGAAASGGYYISCGANHIVADPATLTGSIGVVGLMFTFPRLYEKLGVNWSTVKKGANSDFGANHRTWSDEEVQRMEHYIESAYEEFVGKVDRGRKNLSYDEIHEIAQGRVWTGEQALENGLVDELGGLDTAVEAMRRIAHIKGDIKLVDATTSKKGMQVTMKANPLEASLQEDFLGEILDDYIRAYELWRDFGNEKTLMLSPLETKNLKF
jgi:protease-4